MLQHKAFSHRSRWLMLGLLLVSVTLLALAACAPASGATKQLSANGNNTPGTATFTPTPTQGTSSSADQGTLNGSVVAAPACPVASPDRPCPPKPVPGRQVTVKTPAGTVVATVTTDKNGQFSVNLAPGTYTVQMIPGSSPFPIQRDPMIVTIVAGKTVSVQIVLDSGIR